MYSKLPQISFRRFTQLTWFTLNFVVLRSIHCFNLLQDQFFTGILYLESNCWSISIKNRIMTLIRIIVINNFLILYYVHGNAECWGWFVCQVYKVIVNYSLTFWHIFTCIGIYNFIQEKKKILFTEYHVLPHTPQQYKERWLGPYVRIVCDRIKC